MVIKKRKICILLILLLLFNGCSKNNDSIKKESIAIGEYSILYPKEWDKKVSGDFSYAYSLEDNNFLYGNVMKDDIYSEMETFEDKLPSFRNDYSYTDKEIYYDLKNEYINGYVTNVNGEKMDIFGYFDSNILIIYVGEYDEIEGFLKDSIESINKI